MRSQEPRPPETLMQVQIQLLCYFLALVALFLSVQRARVPQCRVNWTAKSATPLSHMRGLFAAVVSDYWSSIASGPLFSADSVA
mmetsp:Transcript_24316/g.34334  ORF Transcript_24316/g.34334 Transcript_24316/m.34334 type:complete len:84 (-) Transcript_24316:90-341(-)